MASDEMFSFFLHDAMVMASCAAWVIASCCMMPWPWSWLTRINAGLSETSRNKGKLRDIKSMPYFRGEPRVGKDIHAAATAQKWRNRVVFIRKPGRFPIVTFPMLSRMLSRMLRWSLNRPNKL